MSRTQITGLQILDSTLVDADIDAAANIGSSKLATTLSGKTLSTATLGTDLSAGGFKITSLAAPTSDNDAARKSYVDGVAQGLDIKASARLATTVNITLSGEQTIDGVSAVTGNRVLVKNQTTAADNGVYVVDSGKIVVRRL